MNASKLTSRDELLRVELNYVVHELETCDGLWLVSLKGSGKTRTGAIVLLTINGPTSRVNYNLMNRRTDRPTDHKLTL